MRPDQKHAPLHAVDVCLSITHANNKPVTHPPIHPSWADTSTRQAAETLKTHTACLKGCLGTAMVHALC